MTHNCLVRRKGSTNGTGQHKLSTVHTQPTRAWKPPELSCEGNSERTVTTATGTEEKVARWMMITSSCEGVLYIVVTVLARAMVDSLRSPSLWVPRNKGGAPSNFSLMTLSVPSGNEEVGVKGDGTKTLSLKVMGRSCWANAMTSQVGGLTVGFDNPSGRRLRNLSLRSAISWQSLDNSDSRRFPCGDVGLGWAKGGEVGDGLVVGGALLGAVASFICP
ncbi:hypothetical protein EDC04DRAFT_2611214 [Pisolithus marmoratus]|nr:hypothetical protein EDC04DRAFT_2611214 [Pisolithus marmoratus]